MKRYLMLLLCLLLLLTGCGADSPVIPTTQNTVPTTAPTVTTAPVQDTLPQEQPAIPLLAQAEAAGESGNLLYVPNAHVESMACPEMRLYGNGLLLYEHGMDGQLRMKRISLEDGSLLAEGTYSVSPSVRVQIGNGFIGLSDSGTGQVLILNDSLELETTYTVPQEGESWCLNQELETLYVFFPEQGLMSRDLPSGETRWILDNGAFLRVFDVGTGYVLFSYTDRADQKTYNRCLNLSTAGLETLPVDCQISSGIRSGEQWLLRQYYTYGEYVLVNQDSARTFALSEGTAELVSGKRQLLVTDDSYRNLYLYDMDGNFLSRCSLPHIDYASVGTNLVWSGYWQGYFFRDTYDNAAHLMFWDTGVPQEGEDLATEPFGNVQSTEQVMEQSLYERAAALSQRFGLDIRIGEQCTLEYSHYEGCVLTDTYFVEIALDVMERAFGAYPEGFFRQLAYGDVQQIRIELVAGIRGKEDMNTHPVDAAGFAQEMFDYYLVVLDGFSISERTIYHEISHIIDKRLEWDALLRPEALYSEETWLALQPQGFQYAQAYTNMPDKVLVFEDSGYFVSSYAMTFPTEDRATLMAMVMMGGEALNGNPGMIEKAAYYAACIRDCFDTEGWPETTPWERIPE